VNLDNTVDAGRGQIQGVRTMPRLFGVLPMFALGVILVPAVAGAQTNTPVIDQREHNQQERIADGVASGALTPRETVRLEQEQGHIQRLETRAKAGGTVTNQERARIARAQNHASRDIHRQKHDAQRRD
jgi:hypothetical protein